MSDRGKSAQEALSLGLPPEVGVFHQPAPKRRKNQPENSRHRENYSRAPPVNYREQNVPGTSQQGLINNNLYNELSDDDDMSVVSGTSGSRPNLKIQTTVV